MNRVRCVNNKAYVGFENELAGDEELVDLTLGKLYEVVPDPDGERAGLLRVIDDSGEDYLYPAEYFELNR